MERVAHNFMAAGVHLDRRDFGNVLRFFFSPRVILVLKNIITQCGIAVKKLDFECTSNKFILKKTELTQEG